jgi:hypothetical protein
MEKNSMLALSERIKSKKREDQERIQAETQRELQQLAQSLRDTSKAELTTTQYAISDQLKQITALIEGLESSTKNSSDQVRQNLQKDLAQITEASTKNRQAALNSMRWGWLKYSLPALLVLAIICGASWGLMRWQSSQLIAIQQQIDQAQRTLNQLPQGVRFAQDGQGKSFLIYENEPQIFQTQSGGWATELKTR